MKTAKGTKTAKVTKKEAIQLLKDYFRYSERKIRIGAGIEMKDDSYEYRVSEINVCTIRMGLISARLINTDLEKIF